MVVLFFILIILACAILAFFVLIQNPNGGGLSGSFGGIGTQMMGAKQSTDVVEKGTWITGAALVVLIVLSFVMAPKNGGTTKEKTRSEKVNSGRQASTPSAPTPAPAQAPAQAPASQQVPASAPANAPQK